MLYWKVIFSESGQNDLDNLSPSIRDRIFNKLKWFEENFTLIAPLPLTGEFKGFYKFRIGDWRLMYKIHWDKNYIIVYAIDHRSNIYR